MDRRGPARSCSSTGTAAVPSVGACSRPPPPPCPSPPPCRRLSARSCVRAAAASLPRRPEGVSRPACIRRRRRHPLRLRLRFRRRLPPALPQPPRGDQSHSGEEDSLHLRHGLCSSPSDPPTTAAAMKARGWPAAAAPGRSITRSEEVWARGSGRWGQSLHACSCRLARPVRPWTFEIEEDCSLDLNRVDGSRLGNRRLLSRHRSVAGGKRPSGRWPESWVIRHR